MRPTCPQCQWTFPVDKNALNAPCRCPICESVLIEKEVVKPISTILTERKSSHGKFADNARLTCELIKVVEKSPNIHTAPDEVRVATFMILHKLARAFSGDLLFDDHWKDIAGYATLVSNYISTQNAK